MRLRGLLMLGVALILAVIAVFVARNVMQKQVQPIVQQQSIPLTTVVVARTRLDFASRIGPEHLTQVQWPADNVPAGTFKTTSELLKPGEDRVVLRSIEVGEPIFANKISGSGQRASLSSIIGDDMRAMTVRVNDVIGVAGFVLPGDRVDILLTRDNGQNQNIMINDILLQNIRVLGVDQSASDRLDKPVVVKAVTVEVNPLQAQKLTLASSVGSLTMALRNEADSDPTTMQTVTIADLKSGEIVRPTPTQITAGSTIVSRVASTSGDANANIKIIRALKATEYKVRKENKHAKDGKDAKPDKEIKTGSGEKVGHGSAPAREAGAPATGAPLSLSPVTSGPGKGAKKTTPQLFLLETDS